MYAVKRSIDILAADKHTDKHSDFGRLVLKRERKCVSRFHPVRIELLQHEQQYVTLVGFLGGACHATL